MLREITGRKPIKENNMHTALFQIPELQVRFLCLSRQLEY